MPRGERRRHRAARATPPALLAAALLLIGSAAAADPPAPAPPPPSPSPPPPPPPPPSAQQPPVWPQLFSAALFQNRSGALALTELYYDAKRGANLNVVREQLGGPGTGADSGGALFDLELDTGESFVWRTVAPPGAHAAAAAGARVVSCKRLHFDVGILRPDWLEGARHLGRTGADGAFEVDVYEKADFIRYYAEAAGEDRGRGGGGGGGNGENEDPPPSPYARRPVRWVFLQSGAAFDVLEFAVGEDARPVPRGAWRPPKECFQTPEGGASSAEEERPLPEFAGRLYRPRTALQRLEPAARGSNDALHSATF